MRTWSTSATISSGGTTLRADRKEAGASGTHPASTASKIRWGELAADREPVRFGTVTVSRWTQAHHRSVRPDAVWLASVIARLESYPAPRRRLRVVVNELAVVRGDRLVVTWQPHASELGHPRAVEVSVRYTPPVRMVLHSACSPMRVGDLVDKLAAEFPDVERQTVDAMVAELVARGAERQLARRRASRSEGSLHDLEFLPVGRPTSRLRRGRRRNGGRRLPPAPVLYSTIGDAKTLSQFFDSQPSV